MAQAKALDALEPFVALSKSATSTRAAVDLVVRATSHPGTYVFAELLQTPQVQALANAPAEHAVYLTLLQIFSYGTYADYERGSLPSSPSRSRSSEAEEATEASAAAPPPPPSSLPPLNEIQASKLRQLSLISLATDRASLAYAHLVGELRLHNARELETLVMSAVYAGLVSATLDPAREVVRISSVAPLRDLAPGAVPRLRTALQTWSGRCEATLADLDAQIAAIRRAAAAKAEEERRWDSRFNKALEDEKINMLKQSDTGLAQLGGGPSGGIGGGGGGSFLSGASSSTSVHGKKAMTLNMSSPGGSRGKPRFMKRGSNLMTDSGSVGAAGSSSGAADAPSGTAAADDDEGMDLDDEGGDAEANKRSSRRKL